MSGAYLGDTSVYKNFPYRVVTGIDWWAPAGVGVSGMRGWLTKNIGLPYTTWRTDTHNDKICVYFMRSEDAMRFTLEWV